MQEQKVESLNNCISELQQRAYAQRLKLGDTHHGYVESRREQVQLQEELFIKEKALRDTQIRSMHEMGEMKRAQELRLTNSLYRSWEKVTKPYRGSLHKFKNYKKGYHKYLIEEFINLRHQVLQVRFAEIISLDAGLRMDGIPTLDLWNWVIEVFHYSQNQTNKTQGFMGTGRLVASHHVEQAHQESNQSSNHARQFWFVSRWQCAFECEIFSVQCYVVRVWGQRSRD